jgi:sugar-phosphatase
VAGTVRAYLRSAKRVSGVDGRRFRRLGWEIADPVTRDIDIACRAILFDFDGVLVDSSGKGEQAWRQWAVEYGLDEQEVIAGIHGRRSADTVARFLPPHLREEGLDRIETIEIADAIGTEPIPGAPGLLAVLPDNWAIVTSASPALLEARLIAAGLPAPPVRVTATDIDVGKPAPDCYLEAARRIAAPIGECVVVEDSPNGIQAGHAAAALHVLGIGRRAEGLADSVVTDLSHVAWTGTALRIAP